MGADPLGQVERIGGLLDKGPITAVAALFFFLTLTLLALLLKASRDHHLEVAALNARHQESVAQLTQARLAELVACTNALAKAAQMFETLDELRDDVRRQCLLIEQSFGRKRQRSATKMPSTPEDSNA
jgi:hypothetical protein